MENREDMELAGNTADLLIEAHKFNLLPEVIWSAQQFQDNHPEKSIHECLEFGYSEWAK